MKFAETEGTDITNYAETEGTDIHQMAESEGTDSCIKLRNKTGIKSVFLLISLLLSQLAISSDLRLFTVDNQNYKGVIEHKGEIYFVEGYFEADNGFLMLNHSLENSSKATDEGTGGKNATDEGTGGNSYATDEGTGGNPATDEGTGGQNTEVSEVNTGLITLIMGCNNQPRAILESASEVEKIQINTFEINGKLVESTNKLIQCQ